MVMDETQGTSSVTIYIMSTYLTHVVDLRRPGVLESKDVGIDLEPRTSWM